MMGFFEKVKNAFGSKKEYVEYQKIENFKYLDDLIHSGVKEIVLDSDIVLGDDESSVYKDGCTLDVDDLIIDGNGHTIDAQEKTRIFYCTGKNVIIKNIVLKNGFADDGGAIDNEGELTIHASTFAENTASWDGGAIRNDGGELTITESTLINNSAYWKGGAICNRNAKLNLIQTKIINNKADRGGGALSGVGHSKTIVRESIFENNTVKGRKSTDSYYCGGAINNEGEMSIENSSIKGNDTKDWGGGIFNHGNMKIKETLSIGNSAKVGGAIYNISKLNIVESKFEQNTAKEKGGGVYNDYSSSKLDILQTIMLENAAKEKGGAMYIEMGNSTINQSTFTINTAKNGGSICIEKGELSISKTEFIKNSANEGSVLSNENANIKIFNCEISENKSKHSIILNNESLQAYNCNLNRNNSKKIIKNHGEDANMGIFFCKFMANKSGDAIIYNGGKFCSIEKSLFEKHSGKNIIINESDLTLITPKINGDGKTIKNKRKIVLRDSSSEIREKIYGNGVVEIVGQQYDENEEKFGFGYLDEKIRQRKMNTVSLDEDIYIQNYERDFYEGGIELDMDDLIIDGNGHTIDGGDQSRIFLITGENIILKNIKFKNGRSHKNYDNPLNNNGGAIKINYGSQLSIINCEFEFNTSECHGGAIYNGKGDLLISESLLTKNTAKGYGGAIYSQMKNSYVKRIYKGRGRVLQSIDKFAVFQSKLNENMANRGGAIYNEKADFTIFESTIDGNNAKGEYSDGGAIYSHGGVMTIGKSTLNKNTTETGSGGAIEVYGGRLTIYESELSQNTSGRTGGAISSGGILQIENSKFNSNKARDRGGGIYAWDGDLQISQSTLQKNTSKDTGGAIFYFDKVFSRVNDCNLEKNKPNDIIHN